MDGTERRGRTSCWGGTQVQWSPHASHLSGLNPCAAESWRSSTQEMDTTGTCGQVLESSVHPSPTARGYDWDLMASIHPVVIPGHRCGLRR